MRKIQKDKSVFLLLSCMYPIYGIRCTVGKFLTNSPASYTSCPNVGTGEPGPWRSNTTTVLSTPSSLVPSTCNTTLSGRFSRREESLNWQEHFRSFVSGPPTKFGMCAGFNYQSSAVEHSFGLGNLQ